MVTTDYQPQGVLRMACFQCQNVEFGGPTPDQQYFDVFGPEPLPKTYKCKYCGQRWKRESVGVWAMVNNDLEWEFAHTHSIREMNDVLYKHRSTTV